MNEMVRTTITLPSDLYERLKATAFYQKKNLSDLVREGVSRVVSYKKINAGEGLKRLDGKYRVKGQKGEFKRSTWYGELIKKEMSSGY